MSIFYSTVMPISKSSLLESVRRKTESLIADNRRLRSDNEKLRSQRDRLKADNMELNESIVRLEKRVETLELRSGFGGENGDSKLAKARVNRLMREVDKCIALLNR